jgi:hypothetical protein
MQNPPFGQGHVPMPGHNPTAYPSVSNSRERKLKTIAWHSFKSVKNNIHIGKLFLSRCLDVNKSGNAPLTSPQINK